MSEPTVVTVGAGMFADAVADQAVAVDRVDWRPPMPGTEADLATVATDPRRPEANRTAVEAMLGVTAHLVDVAPASEVLGLEPGQFLHAGPPIEWARAFGPLRGALMGGAALEGLVDDPDEPRRPELYRKPEDRWDQNNVIEQHAEVAEHLELSLRRFVEAVPREALDELPPIRDVARRG